jgi:hypothetical protein
MRLLQYAACVTILASCASAGSIFYTDEPLFRSAMATAGLQSHTLTFSGITEDIVTFRNTVLVVNGLTFRGGEFFGDRLLMIQKVDDWANLETGGDVMSSVLQIEITPAANTYALGLLFGATSTGRLGVPTTGILRLENGASGSLYLDGTNVRRGFLGVISDTPLTGVSIESFTASFLTIDDLTTGVATAVPEPATVSYLLVCAVGLYIPRRWYRRRPAASQLDK